MKNASGTQLTSLHVTSFLEGIGSNELSAPHLETVNVGTVKNGISSNAFRGSTKLKSFIANGVVSGKIHSLAFANSNVKLFQAKCVDNKPLVKKVVITDCNCKYAECSRRLSDLEIAGIAVGIMCAFALLVGTCMIVVV